MRKKRNKFNKGSTLYALLLFLFLIPDGKAQSIKRQCIASTGTSVFVENTLIRQTIGQAYSGIVYYNKELTCRPGFQQPPNFSLKLLNSDFSDFNLTVYPNPTTYSVNIKSSKTIDEALLRIFNMNGKLILNEKINNLEKYSINCSNWESGVYLISLYDIQNQKKSTNKLIINK